MPKKKTYGFKDKQVAEELKQLVGGGDSTYVEGRVRGGGGSRLVIARLSAAWSGTAPNITASAELYDMAGNNLSVSITVRDPLAIFAALGSGDDLLAIYQDGKYYAIQAPC